MTFAYRKLLLLAPLIAGAIGACSGSSDIENDPVSKTPITYSVQLVGSLEGSSTKVSEGAADAALEVTFTGGSPRGFTLYADINGDPTDLGTGRRTAEVTAGAATVTIPLNLIDDDVVEGDETFSVAFSGTDDKFSPSAKSYTIVDNDTPYTVTLQDVTVTEPDSGTVTENFEVSIDRNADSDLTLTYAVLASNLDEADYAVPAVAELVIPAGENTGVIPVQLHGDDVDEPDGTLTFTFVQSSQVRFAGNRRTAKMIVQDFEGAPEIAFEVADQTLSERAGVGRVKVVTTIASERTISVAPAISGTASRNRDYTLPSGFMSFDIPSGQRSAVVDIGIVNDTDPEGNETIVLDLGTPSYGVLGAQRRHTITILGSPSLNDTGVTSRIGTAATHPGQDADTGRDAAAGKAAFAFTKIDADGNPLPASAPAGTYSCVRDSVTGLTWEVKQRNTDTTTGLETDFRVASTDPDFDVDADGVDDVNTQPAIGGDDWRAWNARFTWWSMNDSTNGGVRGAPGEFTGMNTTTSPGPQSSYCGFRPTSASSRVAQARQKYQECLAAQAAATPTSPGPASCTMPRIDDGQSVDGRAHEANCNTDSYQREMVFLNVCGRTGWAVPTIEQLRGISNYQDGAQGLNRGLLMPFAPAGSSMQLWSADTVPSGTEQGQAYCLDARTGVVMSCAKNIVHSLLMVSE